MIETIPNLFVGSEADEQRLRGQAGWFFIHACKEPYHRQAAIRRELRRWERAGNVAAGELLGVPKMEAFSNLGRRAGLMG